ncbi:MAG: hypothetical protein WCL44_01500 [bacterium]
MPPTAFPYTSRKKTKSIGAGQMELALVPTTIQVGMGEADGAGIAIRMGRFKWGPRDHRKGA